MNVNKEALEWILSKNTCCSSKTIWSVMMGIDNYDLKTFNTPYDSSDIARCIHLLKIVPEWNSRLYEIGHKYKEWKPFVENWEKIEKLFKSQINGTSNHEFELYDFICYLNGNYDEYINK